jgi:hypothetical protein
VLGRLHLPQLSTGHEILSRAMAMPKLSEPRANGVEGFGTAKR